MSIRIGLPVQPDEEALQLMLSQLDKVFTFELGVQHNYAIGVGGMQNLVGVLEWELPVGYVPKIVGIQITGSDVNLLAYLEDFFADCYVFVGRALPAAFTIGTWTLGQVTRLAAMHQRNIGAGLVLEDLRNIQAKSEKFDFGMGFILPENAIIFRSLFNLMTAGGATAALGVDIAIRIDWQLARLEDSEVQNALWQTR